MKTGTQNRPYTADTLLVNATLTQADGTARALTFNWNDRNAVRYFAGESDACLRAGGKTLLEVVK